MSTANNPIIVAIDTPDIQRAKQLCSGLAGHVGAVKLGLEFFSSHGPAGVREVLPPDMPLFLDLKFHDIPNTVGKAIRALQGLPIWLLTIHTSGGPAMMQAAAEASHWLADQGQKRPNVLGVTVLTSMDQADLAETGVAHDIPTQVAKLGLLAEKSGLDGLVCSPHEIELLRGKVNGNMLLVTPGIRPAGSAMGDQKRALTPKQAVELGADYLVIGRPITKAADPAKAAQAILSELDI